VRVKVSVRRKLPGAKTRVVSDVSFSAVRPSVISFPAASNAHHDSESIVPFASWSWLERVRRLDESYSCVTLAWRGGMTKT
jgi:hypothetical protein